MSYLPCELHCHTKLSGGEYNVEELQNDAVADHIALIALTDVNTKDGLKEINDNIMPTIRGEQWNAYFGNIVALGANGEIDSSDISPDNIDKKINEIRELGGVVGVAQPFDYSINDFGIRDWRSVDYFEVWHNIFHTDDVENNKAIDLWTSLLDKGYRISATYGRDWNVKNFDGHIGVTYVDIDGEVNQQNALRAIRMGRTVASTGAKFFFRVHQKGTTYNIGETMRKGLSVFSFFVDLHARQKNTGEEEVQHSTIKVITNNGKCVLETAISERHVRLDLQKNHWYRAELWGKVNGKSKRLAVTSPVYTD